jgi:hypothetical protein
MTEDTLSEGLLGQPSQNGLKMRRSEQRQARTILAGPKSAEGRSIMKGKK